MKKRNILIVIAAIIIVCIAIEMPAIAPYKKTMTVFKIIDGELTEYDVDVEASQKRIAEMAKAYCEKIKLDNAVWEDIDDIPDPLAMLNGEPIFQPEVDYVRVFVEMNKVRTLTNEEAIRLAAQDKLIKEEVNRLGLALDGKGIEDIRKHLENNFEDNKEDFLAEAKYADITLDECFEFTIDWEINFKEGLKYSEYITDAIWNKGLHADNEFVINYLKRYEDPNPENWPSVGDVEKLQELHYNWLLEQADFYLVDKSNIAEVKMIILESVKSE